MKTIAKSFATITKRQMEWRQVHDEVLLYDRSGDAQKKVWFPLGFMGDISSDNQTWQLDIH